jgi:hypothetical protein
MVFLEFDEKGAGSVALTIDWSYSKHVPDL